jgi:hypothetical protein
MEIIERGKKIYCMRGEHPFAAFNWWTELQHLPAQKLDAFSDPEWEKLLAWFENKQRIAA